MRNRDVDTDADFGQPDSDWVIDTGWDVYGSDGDKVGAVEEVRLQYIVIGKGSIFHTERYLPVSAIAVVENERVRLNITSREFDRQGWNQISDVDSVVTATDSTTSDDDIPETGDRLVNQGELLRVPLVEGEPDVGASKVERGAAHVQKDIAEAARSFDAPLREEELRVQRYRVDREYVTAEIPADAFQEMEILIPIRGEEVAFSTRSVVREEVDISKVVRERDRQVTGTDRREESDLSHADETLRV